MMGPTGPGPWDPAYGYPAGQGTASPQPPPDPQAAQTAQNTGTGAPPPPQQTPQPPTVNQSQTPGFSLNDVALNLQDKQQLDLGERFKTYYDLIKSTLPDAERPHLDESTKPGLLANLVTFGMAGAMDHDYRQAYNAAIDKHNADLHGLAMKNALSMVADDVRQHSGDIGTQIRLLGLYQTMMGQKSLELHRNVMEDLRKMEVQTSRDRLGIAQQELDRKRTIPAPDEKSRAVLESNGFVFVPDPANPGRGWAVDKDSPYARFATHGPAGTKPAGTPAATNPPATPTPDSNAPPQGKSDLGTSGVSSNGVPYRIPQPGQPNQPTPAAKPAGDPSDPDAPGLTPEERYRRKINKEKFNAQPAPPDVQKQVTRIDESLGAMDELEKLVQDPDVKKYIGPGMSRFWSEPRYYMGIGNNPKVDRYIQLVNYLNVQGTGALLNGSRNEKIWKEIQAHLPQAANDPAFALTKIREARDIYRRNRGIELGSAGLTRGEAGSLGTPP